MDITKINKMFSQKRSIFIISLLHCCYTFYRDASFFTINTKGMAVYLLLKTVLLVILYLFWYGIVSALSLKENTTKCIILYAIPCLLILLKHLILENANALYYDELYIYNEAVKLNIFPFKYFTGAIYTLCLMILPHQRGIVLIHIVVQSLLCGYIVKKSIDCLGNRVGFLMYAVFLLAPSIENGLRIHRMHWYGLLFLFVIAKLVFDYISDNRIDRIHLLLLCLAFSILTIWRTEAIYLVVFAPLIIISTYHITSFKKVISVFVVFFAVLSLAYLPELLNGSDFDGAASHTYNAWIVHISRLGLDKSKYPEEMELVDKVVSVEAIDRINNELGDFNYNDEYIAIRKEYEGIRDNVSNIDLINYKHAVIKLILKEPVIFLKTRMGSWVYTSLRAGWISPYNLNIPLAGIVLWLLYAIIKRKWMYFWINSGLLLNTALTILFAPAAYFKYYYHIYLVGWFLIVIAAVFLVKRIFIQNRIGLSLKHK